jgi:hypothetical protein
VPAKIKKIPPTKKAIVVPTEPALYCPLAVDTVADLLLTAAVTVAVGVAVGLVKILDTGGHKDYQSHRVC